MTEIKILYDGPIVKIADARLKGLNRYFTGKPCKHGHVCQRKTSTSNCVECARLTTMMDRILNPEKVNASKARWSNLNPDYGTIYSRRWRAENPERSKENAKASRVRNREERNSYHSEYKANNKEKFRAYQNNRRAISHGAEGIHDESGIAQILDDQDYLCAELTCMADISEGYHVDHIMPLSLGGSNWPANLQCLCPTCNMSKGAKHPDDWARERGRLTDD